MKRTIEKYYEGNAEAKNSLLEGIKELHNYTITNHEALILLYKKYGRSGIV